MDNVDRVTHALRDALNSYAGLNAADSALVIVALFGVAHSKRLAPLLQEVAHNVQPVVKAAP